MTNAWHLDARRSRIAREDYAPHLTRRMVPGDVFLGRYRIERKLGNGTTSVVVEAFDERLEQRVAIKRMRIAHAHDADAVARFSTDTSRALAVGGPHVMKVFDEGTFDGTPYAVVEMLDGVSLERLLSSAEPLPAEVATEIVARVCDALDVAHEKSIVHGAISATAIFIAREDDGPEVKLVGFSSPRSGFIDHRSDVASLVSLLYRALGRVDPFEGTPPSLAFAAGAAPPRDLAEIDGVDPALAAVVSKGLSVDRRDRFQSARGLRVALGAFASSKAFAKYPFFDQLPPRPALSSERPNDPSPARTKGRVELIIALAVGALGVVFLVVLLAVSSKSR